MMTRPELIRALRRMKAETGSLVCLGCGHEHNCDIQGCAIIRAAAEELERIEAQPVRRGRWEWNEDDGHCYCTVCGSVSPESDQNGDECDCPNFCPNCGADMSGG